MKYEIQNWDNLREEITKLPKPYMGNGTDLRWLSLINTDNQSNVLAVNAYIALNDILTTAFFSLSVGCRFDHKMEKQCREAQYRMNEHHLKNAVICYNSAIDYCLQVIYWGFEFYSSMNNEYEYESNLKKCSLSEKGKDSCFMKRFKELSNENSEAKIIYKKFNTTLRSGDVSERIRGLANSFKHHWGFSLKDTYTNPKNHYYYTSELKSEIATIDIKNMSPDEYLKNWGNLEIKSTYYTPEKKIIAYQELVNLLVNMHLQLIDFQELLFDKLGFNKIIDDKRDLKFSAKCSCNNSTN